MPFRHYSNLTWRSFSKKLLRALYITLESQPEIEMLKTLLITALVTQSSLVMTQTLLCNNISDLAIGIVDFGFPADIVSFGSCLQCGLAL